MHIIDIKSLDTYNWLLTENHNGISKETIDNLFDIMLNDISKHSRLYISNYSNILTYNITEESFNDPHLSYYVLSSIYSRFTPKEFTDHINVLTVLNIIAEKLKKFGYKTELTPNTFSIRWAE
jgi:hypothetical protein